MPVFPVEPHNEIICTFSALSKVDFEKQDLNSLRTALGNNFNIQEKITRTIAEDKNKTENKTSTVDMSQHQH